jgi:hypothetical protein
MLTKLAYAAPPPLNPGVGHIPARPARRAAQIHQIMS